ncbi:MAG: hypothetical protein Q9221_002004 [Calogaya cf. arnoldii]
MVATRSQDQKPAKASKEPVATGKKHEKRKRIDDTTYVTTFNTDAKKPKIEGASRNSKNNLSSTLAAVVIPATKHDIANVPSIEYQDDGLGEVSEPKARGAEQEQLRPSTGNRRIADEAKDSTIGIRKEVKATKSRTNRSRKEPDKTKRSISSTKTTSSTPRKAKGLRTVKLPTDTISSEDASALDAPAQLDNKHPNSRHKRFESEEATTKPLSPSSASVSRTFMDISHTIQDTLSESSDDEAPEVVTQSSGRHEAHFAAAEAVKAAETQRAAEKQRRRDRDSRLKSQAKISKVVPPKFKSRDKPSDTSSDDGEDDQKPFHHPHNPDQDTWTSKDGLPALLPDEILAAEPMARMPTPPPKLEVVKATVNTRHRFLDQVSKPPKDIQKGKVRIRVLEDRRAILPPKVSKHSQMLRESWLAGRRGPKGKVVMERKKMGTGFVRR